MPAAEYFLHPKARFLSLCLFWSFLLAPGFAAAQSAPEDANLYYRRTHGGLPLPPDVDPADHSSETTDILPATAKNIAPPVIRPRNLDNGIVATNLGKGDWIWQMPTTATHLGLVSTDVQGVINHETNLGMQWITVKCGDGGSIWTQFSADLVNRAHAAGLKIFGWAYAYGNDVPGEINVAINCLNLGADGFIIDAEGEYEVLANNATAATNYCQSIRAAYPNRFLAHAPFPYLDVHAGFPYATFGFFCDAVMPQVYWGAIGTSPENVVVQMNSRWRTWQAAHPSSVKPLVPLGQSYAPVTGAEIARFMNALVTNTPMATVGGYRGVSFWDAQERTADLDNAVHAASVGPSTSPPIFGSQPSSRSADRGGALAFTTSAFGAAPLKYQWRFNGVDVANATNSTHALTNIQTTNAGNYTVVATNTYGSITSRIAVLTVNPPFTPVFSDNFDVDSAANWTLNQSSADTRIAFAYNYSGYGIPAAPNSVGGTTKGVKFEANISLAAVAALNISPVGQSFSGNYRLHYDLWINQNGPFPAGGTGSTQHHTSGVGTSGNQVQWNFGSPDGVWFATDGEGQATDTSATLPDWRAYNGSTLQSSNSGVYAGGSAPNIRGNGHPYYQNVFPGGQAAPAAQVQTGSLDPGTIGFAWRDVVVNKTGNNIEWFIDGLKIANIGNVTLTSSNIFIGYWDSFASLSSNTNLSFCLVDNLRVEVPAVAPTISLQPLAVAVKVTSNATFNVAATGTPPPTYQWRLSGTNIAGAALASYTRSSVQYSQAGNYSVLVSNIAGAVISSNAVLTILPAAPAEFQTSAIQPDSSLLLGLGGDVGASYFVETSTNLVDWAVLTNISLSAPMIQFNIGATTNNSQRYFRARSAP